MLKILKYFSLFILLPGCTQIFYIRNYKSEQFHKMKVVYKNPENFRTREINLKKMEKRGSVRNVSAIPGDSASEIYFEIAAKRNLPAYEILYTGFSENKSLETILLCTISPKQTNTSLNCDTVLYKEGNKIIINKFTERLKFFRLMGKKTFAYDF